MWTAIVEQKIVLVSPYASQLTLAAEALLALLWPLDWYATKPTELRGPWRHGSAL